MNLELAKTNIFNLNLADDAFVVLMNCEIR